MRVIITGGTGLIGSKLSASLAKDGHEVIILSRNPAKHALPTGVRAEKWDAQTANGWGHLADGAGAIINLAGENISGNGFIPARWTPERKKRIEQSRLDAGQAIVSAIKAAKQKPGVVIQASGVDYYPDSGTLVDELASPGNSFLGDVVTNCWEPATAEVESMGVRRVIARLGLVLSMDGGALPITVLPYRLFVGGPLGSGNQWWSWVHIDDVVAALKFFIENKNSQGAINVTAPNPLTNKAFGKVIGKVLKRPSFFPVPAFALKLLLGEIAAIVLEGRNVSSQKLQDLGFSFTYTEAESALHDLL
ncbi:MAG: TIGR01777 family protein [Chloroflexi bacterium]|nr:MAG: TIGR01777 family protein [Chloroflexota bacterium]